MMPALTECRFDVDDVHPVDAPRGNPSTAQRVAVQDAELRARHLLPGFVSATWSWFHMPSSRVRALTRARHVYVADDLPPAEAHHVGLHECMHVRDARLIPRISHAEAERRAELFALYAMGGDTSMTVYSELCRRVDALCAQGLSRAEAWRRVDPSSPFRHDDPAPTVAPTGSTRRNGHGHSISWPPSGPIRFCVCGAAALPSSPSTARCIGCGRTLFTSDR
jgi:hypothetical protein